MKSINLAKYKFEATLPDGKKQHVDVDVKNMLVDIIFHPELKLSAKDVVDRAKLADKIEACKATDVKVEEAEYAILKNSVDGIRGFGKIHLQFIQRIYDAKDVKIN